ncbi:MAG: ATP-binding protein [Lachnospiraceae bacterium]|nr:ATP-binding protein [Lachnospiraceae bacterium]
MALFYEIEVEKLNEYYTQSSNQIVVVYGQKNIDEGNLINLFLQNKTSVYFKAQEAMERQQCYLWAKQFSYDSVNPYPDFSELFEGVYNKNHTEEERMVFVFDGFHNLIKYDGDFMGHLIEFLKRHNEVFVLLVSTSIGFIENSMVSKIGRNALYINQFIKIKELPFKSVCGYFYNCSKDDCLNIYSIFGGFPKLWKRFDRTYTFRENMVRLLEQDVHFFEHETKRILGDELRELSVYSTILSVLASGKTKLNDIYDHTGFSRAKISVYLKQLIELEVVEKVFSMETAGHENTQKGIYKISNPLVRFYYTYFYPNESVLGCISARQFFEEYISPYLREYAEESFALACLQYMDEKNQENKLPERFGRMSQWVGKAGTISVMAVSDNDNYLIAHCSYRYPKMKSQDYEWLLYLVTQARVEPKYYYLFAVTGFDETILEIARKEANIKTVLLGDM